MDHIFSGANQGHVTRIKSFKCQPKRNQGDLNKIASNWYEMKSLYEQWWKETRNENINPTMSLLFSRNRNLKNFRFRKTTEWRPGEQDVNVKGKRCCGGIHARGTCLYASLAPLLTEVASGALRPPGGKIWSCRRVAELFTIHWEKWVRKVY